MTTTDSDNRIRKRRSHGSSSDRAPTSTEDGIIEIDYRAGGPVLCESPCISNLFQYALPREHKYYNLVANEAHKVARPIVHLCNDENIGGLVGVHLAGRQSMCALQDEPVPTLLISMDRIQSDEHERDRSVQGKERRSWTDLVRIFRASLRKSLATLRQSGLDQNNLDLDADDFSVEVTDVRFDERESIHPCYPTDAISPVWTDVAEEIMARVLDPTGIFTIGCFRVGGKIYTRDRYWEWTVKESRERCPPTVVIGVDRLVKRDWTQVRETVIAILDARGLDEVAVLIRKDADSRPEKVVGDWDPIPWVSRIADGILVWDLVSTTRVPRGMGLGSDGFNERNPLSPPPEEGLSAEDVQILLKWKRDGVNSKNVHKRHLLAVESPSRKDVEKGIHFLTDGINQPGLDPNGRSDQMREEWKKDREAMKEYLDNSGNLFAEVFALSGLRVAPFTEDASKLSIRDWALIVIVTALAGRELGRLCRHLPITDQSLRTIGRNNSNVRWKYANLKVYHISRPMTDGRKQPILTWEHAMVRNGYVGPLGDERDSGALVLDQAGRAVGMVFGGSMSGYLVYFTSVRDLVDDINRSSTGVKAVRVLGDEF
ncbi:hypothetical protein BJX66DRAFT_340567 [Aspergillus keveii]|uniref:Uncharacterized protein n=1 Tax=Aspergillus keveii TaxID=714993 RepID=A0ABR4FXR6_9EURO